MCVCVCVCVCVSVCVCVYIYIYMRRIVFIVFNCISTLDAYLMLNPVYSADFFTPS